MKKQFAIKPVQVVKSITNLVAKSESASILKFLTDGGTPCCSSWDLSKMVATR